MQHGQQMGVYVIRSLSIVLRLEAIFYAFCVELW